MRILAAVVSALALVPAAAAAAPPPIDGLASLKPVKIERAKTHRHASCSLPAKKKTARKLLPVACEQPPRSRMAPPMLTLAP